MEKKSEFGSQNLQVRMPFGNILSCIKDVLLMKLLLGFGRYCCGIEVKVIKNHHF